MRWLLHSRRMRRGWFLRRSYRGHFRFNCKRILLGFTCSLRGIASALGIRLSLLCTTRMWIALVSVSGISWAGCCSWSSLEVMSFRWNRTICFRRRSNLRGSMPAGFSQILRPFLTRFWRVFRRVIPHRHQLVGLVVLFLGGGLNCMMRCWGWRGYLMWR
jgi:hypothetical protein